MSLQNDQLLSSSLDTTSGTLIKRIKCKIHKGEKNKYICFDCTCFVCSDCNLGKHKNHDVIKIQEVASEYKSKALKILTESDLVPTLKSLSILKYSLLKERENLLISATDFKEKLKTCTSEIVRIVQRVSEDYMTEATDFQDEQEESYRRELNNIKDFEEFHYALHTELKNVIEEENEMSLVTSFFGLQQDITKLGQIPCPQHVESKTQFESNLMVSSVVNILTTKCNMQNKEKEKEEMLEKTLQEKEVLIKSLNENIQRQQEEFKAILDEKNCEFEIIKSLNQQQVTQEDPLPIPTQERYTKNLITSLEFEKQLLQTRLIDGQKERENLEMTIRAKEEDIHLLNQKLSMVAGRREDSSDPNRPERLGEQFREIYDYARTVFLDQLTENRDVTDEIAVKEIVKVLQAIYNQCRDQMKRRKQAIIKIIGYPEDTLERQYTGGNDGHDLTVKIMKDLVDASVNHISDEVIQEIKKCPGIKDILRMGGRKSNIFVNKCSHLCLFMVVQDPPVVLDFSCQSGDPFNKDMFSPFISSGEVVDYLVWPVVYLSQGGAIMSKGIAQGKNVIKQKQTKGIYVFQIRQRKEKYEQLESQDFD